MASTTGIKMGRIIIITVTELINMPRIIHANCMAIIMNMGGMVRPIVNSTRPRPAPLKARIWLKATDPKMSVNIMHVINTVFITDFLITSQFSFLYAAAKMAHPMVPVAAASDGVAIPRRITPITINMMNPIGRMYFTAANNLSDNGM